MIVCDFILRKLALIKTSYNGNNVNFWCAKQRDTIGILLQYVMIIDEMLIYMYEFIAIFI